MTRHFHSRSAVYHGNDFQKRGLPRYLDPRLDLNTRLQHLAELHKQKYRENASETNDKRDTIKLQDQSKGWYENPWFAGRPENYLPL